jgi:hypothetical protein
MNAPSFSPAFAAELEQLFIWRRDVRHFRTDPLPDRTLTHPAGNRLPGSLRGAERAVALCKSG